MDCISFQWYKRIDSILSDCASIHIIELLPFTESGQDLSLFRILNRGVGLKNFSVKRRPSKKEAFSVKKGDAGLSVPLEQWLAKRTQCKRMIDESLHNIFCFLLFI